MELLIAILIALGSLTNSGEFTAEYQEAYSNDIIRAEQIIESGSYTTSKDGGVVINEDLDG